MPHSAPACLGGSAPTPRTPPACRRRRPGAPAAGGTRASAGAPPAPRWAPPPAGTARTRGTCPTAGVPLRQTQREARRQVAGQGAAPKQGAQWQPCVAPSTGVRQACKWCFRGTPAVACMASAALQALHEKASCAAPTAPATCRPPAVRARSHSSRILACPALPPCCTSGSKSRANLGEGGRGTGEAGAGAREQQGWMWASRAALLWPGPVASQQAALHGRGKVAPSPPPTPALPASPAALGLLLTRGTASTAGPTGSPAPPRPSAPGCEPRRRRPRCPQSHPTASQTCGEVGRRCGRQRGVCTRTAGSTAARWRQQDTTGGVASTCGAMKAY